MTSQDPALRRAIGRMLMVGVRGSSWDDPRLREDLEACQEAGVKGVILFDIEAATGESRNIISPGQVRELTKLIRETLGDGALIAVDQEGGAVARLSPRLGFEARLGAAEFAALDPEAQRVEAAKLAQCVARSGCNVNLAPCVDVAVNPENPIIARRGRSYSSSHKTVTACASVVVKAHSDADVLSCLKHFPGHGSATGDSHFGFVDITASFNADRELTPYSELAGKGAQSPRPAMVMTGHLFDARIDPDHPASLSRRHTHDLLRCELGFDGVIVTDSLDMGAIAARYGPREAIALAAQAGADMLLCACNAPAGVEPMFNTPAIAVREMVEAIERAVRDGEVEGGVDRIVSSAGRIETAAKGVGSP